MIVTAELPGMDDDDIEVRVSDSSLMISGERRLEEETGEGSHRRVERAYGRFERTVSLPPNADPDGITARLQRGVLEVRVPKSEEPEPRRIAVEGEPSG